MALFNSNPSTFLFRLDCSDYIYLEFDPGQSKIQKWKLIRKLHDLEIPCAEDHHGRTYSVLLLSQTSQTVLN